MSNQDLYQTLEALNTVIASRKGDSAETSYSARLFAKGREKIAGKVGEEAVELAMAAVQNNSPEIVAESADLLFHLLVLWQDAGVELADIAAELNRREGTSGIDEKASRKG